MAELVVFSDIVCPWATVVVFRLLCSEDLAVYDRVVAAALGEPVAA